jgi:hypothetical protein
MLISFEVFLAFYFIFFIGIYFGIKLSIRVLNVQIFDDLAETSLKKSVRQASAIHCMLGDEVYRMITNELQLPPNSEEVRELLKKGIHLN